MNKMRINFCRLPFAVAVNATLELTFVYCHLTKFECPRPGSSRRNGLFTVNWFTFKQWVLLLGIFIFAGGGEMSSLWPAKRILPVWSLAIRTRERYGSLRRIRI